MELAYLKNILTSRVYDIMDRTPLQEALRLSANLDNRIWFKREDTLPIFSFKLRGAYNKMSQLSEKDIKHGVIASSAGNHAQGVALSARTLGIAARVVMPMTTPDIKVEAVRRLGAEAILKGETYDEAFEHAMDIATETGACFIHPFEDPQVIAGQGTIGMEILQQHGGKIDGIFVPVGGGGLIGGIAAYIKSVRPDIPIYGVEPEEAPSMHASLAAGKRIRLHDVGMFADGVAVREVGTECFRLAQAYVEDIILVPTDAICAAIRDIFEETRTVAEPAGALALAGLKQFIQNKNIRSGNWIVIISGANITFDRLRHVAERTSLGAQQEALLAVTIPERAGSFCRFANDIGQREITEFNYRYSSSSDASIFAGIRLTRGLEEQEQVISSLRAMGYSVMDMSHNEMAKLHIRYMVGGHAPFLEHEVLYRIEFPQKVGALASFLSGIGEQWNITMFHFRNHSSDTGRALVGLQIPHEQRDRFHDLLRRPGWRCIEETNNPAYQSFLGAHHTGS